MVFFEKNYFSDFKISDDRLKELGFNVVDFDEVIKRILYVILK